MKYVILYYKVNVNVRFFGSQSPVQPQLHRELLGAILCDDPWGGGAKGRDDVISQIMLGAAKIR